MQTGEVDPACRPVDYLPGNLSAPRQPLHDRVELVEVADLQGEQTLLAQAAQLEIGFQPQRFFDALLQRLRVGALGRLVAVVLGRPPLALGLSSPPRRSRSRAVSFSSIARCGHGQRIGQADQRARLAG